VIDATIAIVTKDRRDELRRALTSATAQRGSVEVLVVDDGSTDGTAEMVRADFPKARLHRFESSEGLVVRRNDAAMLAHGRVFVSIDDDAVFSSPNSVAQTVQDFDSPRVAVVAMPYFDVKTGSSEQQRAPDDTGVWVGPTFRGTAFAVERDTFLAVGGFRELIVHQGEEPDLALRLLATGRVVRLGRGDPIHHFESPRRDLSRMARYGRRNELLLAFTYFPFPWNVAAIAAWTARGILIGARLRVMRATLRGLCEGVVVCWRLRRERRPVSRPTMRLDRRLRRSGALPLESVEPQLPALACKPVSTPHDAS
jgi:glycosyltransferase involved in cell wall biosynthesis